MTFKETNENLLSKFPQLKEKFEEETSWQEGLDTGSFVVFEDVFMPYVKSVVSDKKEKEIKEVFSYIEFLANVKDDYVKNIVYVAILENIASFNNPEEYIQYFQEKTKQIYDENYR